MRIDDNGNFWFLGAIIGAVVGAVVSAAVEVASQIAEGKSLSEVNWADVGVSAGSGAITGALAGSGVGIITSVVANGVVGFGSSVASDLVNGREVDWIGAGVSGVAGAVSGRIGGAGMLKNNGIKGAVKQMNNVLSRAASGTYYSTLSGARSALTQSMNRLSGSIAYAGGITFIRYCAGTGAASGINTIYSSFKKALE